MARPIDADKLMEGLNRKKAGPHDRKYTEGFNDALARFRSMIHSASTVSPDEVRGVGKWIERVDYDWDVYHECSVCHTPFTMLDGTTPELNDYHYCPNCGAKMEVSEDA